MSLRWGREHVALFECIGLAVGVGRAVGKPETDTYWSARYGLDLISTGRFPHADTYSWTASGHRWIPNSWGWNAVLGLLYRAFGVGGFALIVVVLGLVAGIVVGRTSERLGASPVYAAIVFAAFAPIMIVSYARAETMSCLVVLAIPPLVARLMRAPVRSAARYGLALVVLEVVWVNLHSAAFVEPVLIGAGGLAVLVKAGRVHDAWRRAMMRLVPTVVATGLACLATPYGLSAVLHVPAVRRASAGVISEWDHPGFGTFGQVVGLIALLMAVGASVLAWRAGHPSVTGVLLALGVGTVSAIRFAPMVIVVATPVLGAALSRANVRPHMARLILAVGCVITAGLALNGLRLYGQTERLAASPSLVRALPAGCRVVNDYDVGAAIVLMGNDNRVSIDGRNDLYGRAKVVDAIGMLRNRPGTTARLDAAGVDCVLAQPRWPLVRVLAADPGWRIAGSDGVRLLLVRRSG